MKALVISVLATGALVAFLAPQKPLPGREEAAAPPDVHLDAVTAPQGSNGELALDRAGDGHFYATAQIDTHEYRMLVDTGASVVALTGNDAQDLGLTWDPNALVPVGRGASGTVMGVPITIGDMAVGDFEARDVEAVIIPDGLAVSLLGQSFLHHIPKVDIAGDTLTLSD